MGLLEGRWIGVHTELSKELKFLKSAQFLVIPKVF
jgi:hypothetical protein